MSSLQENVNATVPLDVVDKRKVTNFSRIDSFDKLHFTAFYTIQLAGTLLSQKSFLQLLDLIQYKTRNIWHSSIMLMLLPTFEVMCGVCLHWFDSIAHYFGFNAVHEKKTISEPQETYILRLKKQKAAAAAAAAAAATASAGTAVATENDRSTLKTIDEINVITPRSVAFVNSLKSRSDSEESLSSSNRHNIGLVVIVYGSATLVYVQLMFLAAFLQTTATPPGLLFLVTSLAFIGYIVFKMCFVKSKAKDDTNSSKSPKISSKTAKTAETQTALKTASIIDDDETPLKKPARIGRSFTRRFLYFHNKTLSKIKLL